MPEKESDILNREEVRRDFRRILNQQTDIGAAKILGNCLFDAPNIFDPNSRRKLKTEILIVLSYVLLIAVTCAIFNFR